MKVYVDELPESCKECPFSATTYYWKENNLEKTLFKISCKLGCSNECCFNSLSDYTKQVRKEVCKEIRKQIKKEYIIFDSEEDRKAFNKILKQIQGESNET